uniref:Uncharacterized protein n=1 Tax=Oryza glumipatula TaxID=40148 RepID=A0A0E0B8B0_9ORYZ
MYGPRPPPTATLKLGAEMITRFAGKEWLAERIDATRLVEFLVTNIVGEEREVANKLSNHSIHQGGSRRIRQGIPDAQQQRGDYNDDSRGVEEANKGDGMRPRLAHHLQPRIPTHIIFNFNQNLNFALN